MKKKERMLSCIQPTGDLHLGNYLGAIKNWVALENDYDCIYGIVDLHAMTIPYTPIELRETTKNMIVELMACGIDIKKCKLFIQSLVPQHMELFWIFNCITPQGELSRMTQFKDKSKMLEEKSSFISVGLFNYPILQAADILIYKADLVPVGKDQEQHLEFTRNIASRFNFKFGNYFTEPKALYTKIPKLMSLADPTKKMSKSLGEKHYIGLFESEENIRQKIKSAVTDSGEDQKKEMSLGVANLFKILDACGEKTDYNSLKSDFEKNNLKYKNLKEVTSDAVIKLTSGFIERKKEILNSKISIQQIREMSFEAEKIAKKTIYEIKERIGLIT